MPDPASQPQQPLVEPERLDLRSMDIAEARRQELLRLFPEVRTEGGKIDFDRLRLALGEAVDVGRERYGMNWPGKADCFKTIQTPSMGTLRPCPEESVNWDTTENLIIEGDNLEVLKLLQKSCLGKVKMIYIDPPYNTGNDFIYPDNYAESLQTYLEYTGQVDSEGRRFGTNTEADGRFHSRWMNMMYPRLYLARNLLRDDGAVFISIDEAEQANLRHLCDEIFGQENFVADLVWAAGRKNDSKHISVSHEYIVVYARNMEHLKERGIVWRHRKEGLDDIYKAYARLRKEHGNDHAAVQSGLKEWFAGLPDTHPAKAHRHYSCVDARGIYFPADISWPGGGGPKYEVLHPRTGRPVRVPSRGWMTSDPDKMAAWIADDRVHFGEDENSVPCIKSYLSDREDSVPYSVFYQDGRAATKRLRDLLNGDYFENPKDEGVIGKLVEFATEPDSLVVDFFAGSGTTAHAVLDLNKKDGGNRQFILVQLPEPVDPQSAAGKAGFKTIADICKERVRRVINRLDTEDEGRLDLSGNAPRPDRGFRVYSLAESNFKPWQADGPKDGESLGKHMFEHVEHIREGRTEDDLLYEILLKSGFALTTPIETLTLAGRKVYSVAGGALMLCLERPLTLEVIRAIAEKKPERVVCLDAGFVGNDQLKTNAVQTFKTKGVGSFKTV
ncbi:MAG: site-specific DNA-methyltransferase [Phycisphaerae bacterium]|nr:site-specific DNA-methyltransferase [Phycisphaerae bacterium]